jgi:hypothetical protein
MAGAAVVCVLGCLVCGCSGLSMPRVPWHKVPLDATAGFYDSASIVYRLDAGKIQQPLDVARFEGQKISYEQFASSPLAGLSTGALAISYPHPAGRVGWAQVKFSIDSAPPKPKASRNWNPFKKKSTSPPLVSALATSQTEFHELWVLDISRAESDQFFQLLAAQSFYNTERGDGDGTELTVTVNGKQVRKYWQQIPEFNALAQRVRREGRLAAYSRPGTLAGNENPISSTPRYREIVAQTGTPEAAAALAALASGAFAMPQGALPQPAVSQPALSQPPFPQQAVPPSTVAQSAVAQSTVPAAVAQSPQAPPR